MSFTSINPANGRQVWSGPGLDATEIEQALAAAAEAAPRWAATPVDERCRIVRRAADILRARRALLHFVARLLDELANLEGEERGEFGAACAQDISGAAHDAAAGIDRRGGPARCGLRGGGERLFDFRRVEARAGPHLPAVRGGDGGEAHDCSLQWAVRSIILPCCDGRARRGAPA